MEDDNPLSTPENTHDETGHSDALCEEPVQSHGEDSESDIVVAILRAFKIVEEMGGSQKNLLDIVTYGKDLYCKGDLDMLNRWPTTWTACIRILKDAGYKEPIAYYVCLDNSHSTLWSVLKNPSDNCQYCMKPGTIPFYINRQG